MSLSLTLVTDDVGEFSRVRGLALENWRVRDVIPGGALAAFTAKIPRQRR